MIPESHPRYKSLVLRDKVKNAFLDGMLSDSGMIAHGRGEAFDYLIGEETSEAGFRAIDAAAVCLLLANYPVISVNGNTAALVSEYIVELSSLLDCKIEINLFYRTSDRVDLVEAKLKDAGALDVLGTNSDDLEYLGGLDSPRATASSEGIYKADVVLVPLEDGDRGEVLVENGKKVICIDLNPLSRTSLMCDVSIVDNIVRALPLLIERIKYYKGKNVEDLEEIYSDFDNKENLELALDVIKSYSFKK